MIVPILFEVNMRILISIIIFFPVIVWGQITIPISLSANFVQKVTTPHKKLTKYTGTLKLNRTRQFLWLYRSPTKREICGDGNKVRIIDHDLEQVTVYKVGSLLDLMQLLKRAKLYKGDIYLTKYHGVRYTLKVNKSGQIEQIAYKDKMDNVINIHFYKMKYNKSPYAPSKLRCRTPKSYDVIKG
jgi:outer membrane lipoprotein carrier protein